MVANRNIRPVITDINVVTALGDNLQDTWNALIEGKSSIREISRFSTVPYCSHVGSLIEKLDPIGNSARFNSIVEKLAKDFGQVPADTYVITATTKAGIDNLERHCGGKQTTEKDLLLFTPVEAVSRRYQLSNIGFNVNAACASSTIAVAEAAQLIASGRVSSVLICCFDVITEFVFSGFSSLRAMSGHPCKPFDRNRDGLSLGEGGAVILMMSEEQAEAAERRCLGYVEGWGGSNDAVHMTAPDRGGGGLSRTIEQALTMAGIHSDDINVIVAHGTGTVYNDMMELTAFRSIFQDRKIPSCSVKGAIGHTLGAAGGIEVALGIRMLNSQTVPPTAGFEVPEKGAENCFSSEPATFSGDYLLTVNSGFGGVNAGIILRRGKQA